MKELKQNNKNRLLQSVLFGLPDWIKNQIGGHLLEEKSPHTEIITSGSFGVLK
jgi:hypothetical protein